MRTERRRLSTTETYPLKVMVACLTCNRRRANMLHRLGRCGDKGKRDDGKCDSDTPKRAPIMSTIQHVVVECLLAPQ